MRRGFAAALLLALALLPASALARDAQQIHAGTETAPATVIELGGDMSALPDGVRAEGNVVTVEGAGTYWFTGALDGQLVVETSKKARVTLVLDGVSLTNETEAALYVKKAGMTTIYLPEGSVSRVQSGEAAALDGSAIDPDAQGGAIHAKDDLAIEGSGALWVGGYINNGVHTSGALMLSGGTLTVEAVNNGLKGKDRVTLADGAVSVSCGGNGVVSDDETGEGFGVVTVSGGTLSIVSAGDAVQAETLLEVRGGVIDAVAGGGSANASRKTSGDWGFGGRGGFGRGNMAGDQSGFGGRGGNMGNRGGFGNDGVAPEPPEAGEMPQMGDMPQPGEMPDMGDMPQMGNMPEMNDMPDAFAASEESAAQTGSTKGLKSGAVLRITGGEITVDAQDDAIHSNGVIEMTGGTLVLSSGDDGMHADERLTIDGGEVSILTSYEGIEANQVLISGGVIDVVATDDGINANGGQAVFGRRAPGGRDGQEDGEMPNLLITGGTVHVDAQGDGLDSNGNLRVEGGVVVVDGPADGANGALDAGAESGGTCEVHGGTVLAIGSAGMAETFDAHSTQVSFMHSFGQSLPAGSEITVTAQDGSVLFTHTAARGFASVVFSSPELAQGDTVTLTAGDQSVTLTLDSVSVQSGVSSGFGGFGGFGGGRRW